VYILTTAVAVGQYLIQINTFPLLLNKTNWRVKYYNDVNIIIIIIIIIQPICTVGKW